EVKRLKEQLAQLTSGRLVPESFLTKGKMNGVLYPEDDHVSILPTTATVHAAFLMFPNGFAERLVIMEMSVSLNSSVSQIEHHPRVAKYAMENHSLREENRRLRLLEPVKRAQEMDAQTIAVLEKAFSELSGTEKRGKGQQGFSPKTPKEPCSLVNTEKLKAQLLQIQTELNNSKQEYEEFKELTSPEVGSFGPVCTQNSSEFEGLDDNILNEPIPPDMNDQAFEAISEELRMVQEQMNALQVKLDEEEHKNLRLQQHIDKLEHHSIQTQELFSSERTDWTRQQQEHLSQLNVLEKQLQDTQTKNDFLKSEVHDLRVVLHSADKELSSMKLEYSSFRESQEKELSSLSDRHAHTQLQLDSVRLEKEKLLESKACLQDSYDNLQEVMKFEIDQLSKNLQNCKKENETLKSDLNNLVELFEAEKERNNKLLLQFEEDKENSSKEILEVLEVVRQEKQKEMAKCEQQMAKVQKLEESLYAAEKVIHSLEKSRDADKEVVADLMICEKTETIDTLKQELKDISCKYNSALADKDESKVLIKQQEVEIRDLKEALRLRILSEDIERDMLCEDLAHATEQLNMLTEASKKHSELLQSAQEEMTRKEALIQELKHELNQKKEEVEQKKNEYNFKMRQLEYVMDSAAEYPQSPKTPPHFQTHLAKLLETQEQEIEDGRASKISLQHLVTKLNEDREVKNAEILRIKEQLCEMENLRKEAEQLRERNWLLQSQLDDIERKKDNSEQNHPDHQQLKNEQEEMIKERLAKNKLVEEMLKMKANLEEVQSALQNQEMDCLRMAEEVERTRTLESKAFQEKEQLRSKLEEVYEEKERIFQEMEMLRKQVECLAEENGKLVGHQNLHQKIQYVVRLKKENVRLAEETEKLRAENVFLKEKKKE
uniref:Kinesin family member 15 n=1 Tax=Canis lupus familiaris TaxID=9615 RepID=A0A8I3NUA8_CANLF